MRRDYQQERATHRAAYAEKMKPSANKTKYRREVPPGCVSIFRISQWSGSRAVYHGSYRNEDEAYQVADDLWKQALGPYRREVSVLQNTKVHVEHKAAIEIDGRFHIVNIDPIKFSEPPTPIEDVVVQPSEEHVPC